MWSKIQIVRNVLVLSDVETNKSIEFPIIWLRDNCQCQECFDKVTSSRKIDFEMVNLSKAAVETAKFDATQQWLEITWSDQHTSRYERSWLMERNFSQEGRESYLKLYRPEKSLWSRNDFDKIFKSFNFDEVIESEQVFFEWLEQMAVHGVALIEKAPNTKDGARKIAERVGFIRKTHFGDEFTVAAKENTTTYAYSSAKLQLHVDVPYYQHTPGINLLHCVTQSKTGGENTLVDGFYVAERLREKHPNYFEVLTRVKANWCDYGLDDDGRRYEALLRAPVVSVDDEGRMTGIKYSNNNRDSFFTEPIEDVLLWYEALQKFVELMYEEVSESKLSDGQILCFDNTRILHGRNGYTDTPDNSRCVVGVYVDWDQMYMKWRVLKQT